LPPEIPEVTMVRLAFLLLVCMSFSGSARAGFLDELRAKAAANRAAMIKAGKLPPVQLNQKQISQLPYGARVEPKVVWIGAGRQQDGTIFVCHVTTGKNYFGTRSLALFTGTFEADGAYHQAAAYLINKQAVLNDCWRHGFVPPVRIR